MRGIIQGVWHSNTLFWWKMKSSFIIFFQSHSGKRQTGSKPNSGITDMPWLKRKTGNLFFVFRITQDESKKSTMAGKPATFFGFCKTFF